MSIVLAYHGCDLETAQELLGGSPFLPSTRDYDWLGVGSYFRENDPVCVFQWASEPRRKFGRPSVVGAAIELGNCLDLTTQFGIAAVKVAYEQFAAMTQKTGTPLPQNIDPARNPSGDKVLRRLDCAVMNYLFEILEEAQESAPASQPFVTVRAMFPKGAKLCEDAGFWDKAHFQICVREPQQILGAFRISRWQQEELGLPRLYKNACWTTLRPSTPFISVDLHRSNTRKHEPPGLAPPLPPRRNKVRTSVLTHSSYPACLRAPLSPTCERYRKVLL